MQGVTVTDWEPGLSNSRVTPNLSNLPPLDMSKNEEGAIKNDTGPWPRGSVV